RLGGGQVVPMSSLILTNAHVLTMDPSRPVAQAIGIKGAHIKAVGTEDEVASYMDRSSARVVDLEGRVVVPGFNDCHMHLLPYGLDLAKADLSAAAEVIDITSLIGALHSWADAYPRTEW